MLKKPDYMICMARTNAEAGLTRTIAGWGRELPEVASYNEFKMLFTLWIIDKYILDKVTLIQRRATEQRPSRFLRQLEQNDRTKDFINNSTGVLFLSEAKTKPPRLLAEPPRWLFAKGGFL